MIENDGPGAGGSLVNRNDIFTQVTNPFVLPISLVLLGSQPKLIAVRLAGMVGPMKALIVGVVSSQRSLSMIPVMKTLVIGSLAIGLSSGCSLQLTSAEPDASEAEQPQQQDQSPQPEPESDSAPEIEFSDCSQTAQSGIETTINAQTASFAVGDYELAYSYASPSFRSSVSLQRFIGIIEGSYGPLITSSTLGFDSCLFYPEPELATIDVRFTEAGETVYALRYVLVETELGWRVDGASALASIGSGV